MLPVYTHSETFHADEVSAIVLLKYLGKTNFDSVTRTRDIDLLNSKRGEAYIVDVGGVYDPAQLSFDHHQRDCREYYSQEMRGKGIYMSSFGMVYKSFAAELFDGLITDHPQKAQDAFYKRYVLEIDAKDNGISDLPAQKWYHFAPTQKYSSTWTIQGIIHLLNMNDPKEPQQDKCFKNALCIVEEFFRAAVSKFVREWNNYSYNRDEITRLLSNVEGKVTISSIVVLDDNIDHYQKPLFDIESEINARLWPWKRRQILFTVLPRDKETWQVHTVSTGKFEQRASIIAPEQAKELLGANYTFVHNNRFIGITKSKESAQLLAEESVGSYIKKYLCGFYVGACLSSLSVFGLSAAFYWNI